VRGRIEAPLPSAFIGSFLQDDWTPSEPFADNSEVTRYLTTLALRDLGGNPITQPSEEGDEILARMMAAETEAAIHRSGSSSLNWYTDALRRAFAVAAVIHPELASDEEARAIPSAGFTCADDAKTVLIGAMAITSQNIGVHENMRYALEQYRMFVATGRFSPKPYGAKGQAIKKNLARFNDVLDIMDGDIGRMKRLLCAKFTMGEFRAAAAKFGIKVGGQELASETVHGSMMFGPKVGNAFFQNLMGNHQPITIDLWFMRMWGRYTGTLVRDEISAESLPRLVRGLRRSMRGKRMAEQMAAAGIPSPGEFWDMDADDLLRACRDVYRLWERTRKALVRKGMGNEEASAVKARLGWPGAAESIIKSLGMPVDQPRNGGNRRWIRSVVGRALEILKDSGYEMTAADMQATLWYPEKELYDRLAGRPVGQLNVSYDEALAAIARQEGIPDDEIERALRSVGAERDRGFGRDGCPGQGDEAPARGLRERAALDLGEEGFLPADAVLERGLSQSLPMMA